MRVISPHTHSNEYHKSVLCPHCPWIFFTNIRRILLSYNIFFSVQFYILKRFTGVSETTFREWRRKMSIKYKISLSGTRFRQKKTIGSLTRRPARNCLYSFYPIFARTDEYCTTYYGTPRWASADHRSRHRGLVEK